ncbi:MAG: hydantoinase B/oxoprolinase family protein, partial [Spirosomaceae bacterium]|nr:hydantoinase B/oxoprolinase family protein [Spirosomataceae bacterium]
DAQLLVNAPHIPVHLGSLGVCARLVRDKIPIGVGDVVITNHPRYGGSHLPDVTLLSGVFTPQNELIGYVINRAHHAEIGGRTPGSMPPDATTLVEEGVVILPTYLVKGGEIQWDTMTQLFTESTYPTRSLTDNIADITAALASLRTGEAALQQLAAQHGLAKVHKYMKLLKNSAFEALQKALIAYQNQVFEATESLDDGHEIRVKIDIKPLVGTCNGATLAPDQQEHGFVIHENHTPLALTFDFTGSSPRHPHNLNANVSIIYSAILYVLRLLVNQNIPLNEGLMQGVKVILPDDSFLHPQFSDDPAECPAVVGGNTEVSQRLTDALLKALELAACSQGTMNNFLFGKSDGHAPFGYYETICGGTGASNGAHGRSAVHQNMTNTRITDPEELERRYPVRLEEFSVRQGSGGEGHWRGGDGVVRHVTFLDNLRVTLITQHRVVPPYGLAGGEAGQIGRQTLIHDDGNEELLAGICTFDVQSGDQLRLETPGGGGYGEM